MPSYDFFVGYRGYPEIQGRGRWAVPGGVTRYGKSHVYLEHLAMLDKRQAELGLYLFKKWGSRAEEALQ